MSMPGTLGHGMPSRPVDLDRKVADLERRLAETQGMLVRAANAANAWQDRILGVRDGANSPGLTGSWTTYLANTITVPTGFTGAVINVFCSTGATFSSAGGSYGYVGAQPTVLGIMSGPAISNGVLIPSAGGSTACSVTSAFTAVIPVTAGGTFQIAMEAYATGSATIGAGTDNVHLSASVIFTR